MASATAWSTTSAEPWRRDHGLRLGVGGPRRAGHARDLPARPCRSTPTGSALSHDPEWEQGKLVQELFEALVESDAARARRSSRDYPPATSPLTRQHRDNPRLAEKWDLIVFGAELGTAYSELIDPIEQRRHLTEQSLLAAGGDPEAMELDEDFLPRPGIRHAARRAAWAWASTG